jgi:hypothetical protein
MSLLKRVSCLTVLALSGLALGLPGAAPAQEVKANKTGPLSEAELLILLNLGVEDEAIAARIAVAGTGFKADDAALRRLKKAGASKVVLAALSGKPRSGVLAVEKHKTGLRVEVTQLKRTSDGYLTIRWRYRNPTDKPIKLFDAVNYGIENWHNRGESMLAALFFIDASDRDKRTKHQIVRDRSGHLLAYEFTSTSTTVPEKGEFEMWAKFPAPRASARSITLYMQDVLPFEDLPLPKPAK